MQAHVPEVAAVAGPIGDVGDHVDRPCPQDGGSATCDDRGNRRAPGAPTQDGDAGHARAGAWYVGANPDALIPAAWPFRQWHAGSVPRRSPARGIVRTGPDL